MRGLWIEVDKGIKRSQDGPEKLTLSLAPDTPGRWDIFLKSSRPGWLSCGPGCEDGNITFVLNVLLRVCETKEDQE